MCDSRRLQLLQRKIKRQLNDLLELYVLPIMDTDLLRKEVSSLIHVELFNARTWCPTNFFLVWTTGCRLFFIVSFLFFLDPQRPAGIYQARTYGSISQRGYRWTEHCWRCLCCSMNLDFMIELLIWYYWYLMHIPHTSSHSFFILHFVLFVSLVCRMDSIG